MLRYMREQGEKGQTAVLLALSMIALLGMVGLAMDGGMMYWNQRRAQNAADAASIAGATALVDHFVDDGNNCGGPESAILALVNQYALNNEIPTNEPGDDNVRAFYLTKDNAGNRFDLINPDTNAPWRLEDTGQVPCEQDIAGLRVEVNFPQDTFLMGLLGIGETNVGAEAHAIMDFSSWCKDYVLLTLGESDKNWLSVGGATVSVSGGGIHSNSALHIHGGGSGFYFDPDYPIEYKEGTSAPNISKMGGTQPPVSPASPVELPDDIYTFADFATGEIWNNTPADSRFTKNGTLGVNDILDGNGVPIDGLYVVNGNVKLPKLFNVRPWRATIVATGTIQSSGEINTIPFTYGVMFFTESNNTSPGAVKLSGSHNQIAGMVIAPNGLISMSASKNGNFSGMFVSQRISISGSTNSFSHRPSYCPPEPPEVLLAQ